RGIGGNSFADENVREAGDDADITCLYFCRFDTLDALEGEHLGDLSRACATIWLLYRDVLAGLDDAFVYATDSQATKEVVVREIECLNLCGLGERLRRRGRWHELKNSIEKRGEVFALVVEILHRNTFATNCIHRTEIGLCVVCAEFEEELEHG